MLVWYHKFSTKDLLGTNHGPQKMLNGRKYKFGMNLLATCNRMLHFIDTGSCYPGATSDYVEFAVFLLCKIVENESIIAPGSFSRGNNSFLNALHVATPCKGASHGPKYLHDIVNHN